MPLVCCFYTLVLFLQELQKKEAARGAIGAQSLLAMVVPAPKAPSLAAKVPKLWEPMPAPADLEV